MWKWSTYRPQMTAYLSLWSISEGSPEHRTEKGIYCREESSQAKHYSCVNLERLNGPILDSTLVKTVRMLRANSSAKVLFLATATPSPGSSNLCSTQACQRGANITSDFIFLGHKKTAQERNLPGVSCHPAAVPQAWAGVSQMVSTSLQEWRISQDYGAQILTTYNQRMHLVTILTS